MRRLIVVASLLALVATACKIETNFGAVINADGSGTIIAEVGFDDEAAGFFLQEGGDPFEDNDFSDCPGASQREERRGNLTYYIVECPVSDVTELTSLLTEGGDSMLQDFAIVITDDLVTVSGSASAEDTFGSGELEGFDPAVLEESISASIRVTMPGKILEHNADSQSGNTLTWEIPILGGQLDIQATSDPKGTPSGGGGGGGFPVWLIAVIAVGVLGAAWFLMQRNKGGSGGDSAPATMPAEDTPPPPAAE